jgi:steroid 5-alpha reductase family enzyme
MRKITILLLAVAFAFSSNAGMIYVPSNSTDNVKTGKSSTVDVLSQLDAKSFLALTPAKVSEMTGRKMTLNQKINLKLTQRLVKKQLKKGNDVNMVEMAKRADSGSFNWGAAALGFFLGLIGVLIVYLAFKNDKEAARKAGWIGFAVGLALALIFILI